MHRLFQPKAWEELYQPDHPSKAFQVTVAIMKKFHDEAQDRGQYPIIYILPTRDDTKLYIRYTKIYYHTLIDKLSNIGIEVVDMAQKYSQYLQQNDPSVLTSAKTQYHYSVQGNKILAKITADYIKERKLLNIPGKRISREQHCCPPR